MNIRPKLRMLTMAVAFLLAQLNVMAADVITVKGTVIDTNGEPLLGCTVRTSDGTQSTVTDLDGHFMLSTQQGNTIIISYIGFQSQSVKAASTLTVTLLEDAHTLNEVVSVGYGTMKRSDITGSVVSVQGDDMRTTSAATMDQMLQGRAAGVQLTGNSGAAGASSSVQIRGINSLNSTNEPIYVIDGVIIQASAGSDIYSNPLSDLNPNDVESVEVLKDASATAIYGSQAANGVIIVNMKKGEAGKTHVAFKGTVGYDQIPKTLDVMNLREVAYWVNDVREQAGLSVPSDFADPESLGEGTNWQDELFRNGLRQEYNLSVRGGTKDVKYSVSGNYFNQDGIVIGNSFDRFTMRATIDVKAYKWLDIGATVNISKQTRETGMASWGLISNALGMMPNIPVRNEDGSWGKAGYDETTQSWTPNVVAIASITDRENKITSTRANVYFVVKPWKWLSWRTEGSLDAKTDNYTYLLPSYDLGGTVRTYSTHEQSKDYNEYLSLKSVATGTFVLGGGHKLTAMLGYEMNNKFRDYLWGQRLGGSDTNNTLSAGDASRDSNSGYRTTDRYTSFFGRATYNYADRYMLTATLRADGSSKFERGSRWGWFPSAAGAWRISEEKFFRPLKSAISSLKLRVGYGLVGNANLGDNTFQPTFNTVESNFGTSYTTANIPNYDKLTWEKTSSWNAGLDLSILNGRIEFIFDAYYKKTTDMLMQTTVPYYTGVGMSSLSLSSQWANVGSMTNKGLEFTLNANVINKKKAKWKTTITFTTNKNEITELNNANGFIDKNLDFLGESETITRTAVGRSISEFYGYKVAGRINQASDFLRDNGDGTSTVIAATPNYRVGTIVSNADVNDLATSIGDFLFKDLNNDGIIDANDRTFLGSPLPKFTFGWNNTVTYKNWALTIFTYGSIGGKVFNYTRRRGDEPSMLQSSLSNKFSRVSNYAKWTYLDGNSENTNVWNVVVAEGSDPSIPRIDSNNTNENYRVSDRYVEDADYLRIKNIMLTYTFPKKAIKALHLQSLKLSANVQNVATITGYSGYDPEVGSQNGQYSFSGSGMLLYGVDTGKVPSPRTVLFILDATF